MTTEVVPQQALTTQERLEADCLISLWRKAGEEERAVAKAGKDAEEIVVSCYGKTRGLLLGFSRDFTAMIDCLKAVYPDVQTLSKEGQRAMALNLPQKEMPQWFKEMFDRIMEKVSTDFGRLPKLAELSRLIENSIKLAPLAFDDSLKFLNDMVTALDGAIDQWKSAKDQTRKILENAGFRGIGFDAQKALQIWAQGSESRIAYLRGKNILIGFPAPRIAVSQKQSVNPTGESLRRKKAKQANGANGSAPAPEKKAEPEAPWQIFCITSNGTILDSLKMLLTDNGDRLAEILNRHYSCQLDGNQAIDPLRRLTTIKPAKRKNFYRVDGTIWYRLKPGKYRLYVRVVDLEHKIFLMAGHKTDKSVLSFIGKTKDES